MKRIYSKLGECYFTRFKLLILIGLFLFSMLSLGRAQTRLTSIDGVYIERTNRIDPSTGKESDMNATEVVPYFITESKIVDGDVVAFDIPGFDDFMRENKKFLKNVILKIDKIELPEFPAYIEDAESDVVRFRFTSRNLNSDNRKLLYKLPGTSTKEVLLGLKIDESTVLYFNEPTHLWFKEIERMGRFGWILIASFFLFFILLIFRYKSVIKDSVSQLEDTNVTRITCYSFSKSQFAFWTFIVLASFIYIWAFTGEMNSINTTGLILLGITSVTITTANLINKSENDRAGTDKAKLIHFRTKESGNKSNFLQDILSDADGISIHRLQAFIFNLVFGIAFFQSVFWNYSMPEFSETQLILLGLSNGTYAFLKNSENK